METRHARARESTGQVRKEGRCGWRRESADLVARGGEARNFFFSRVRGEEIHAWAVALAAGRSLVFLIL